MVDEVMTIPVNSRLSIKTLVDKYTFINFAKMSLLLLLWFAIQQFWYMMPYIL